MKLEWFKHLKTPEEQAKFKENVLGAKKILDRLQEICYNRVQNGKPTSLKSYESPSWSYLQADRVGYERAYNEIISLLDINSDQE